MFARRYSETSNYSSHSFLNLNKSEFMDALNKDEFQKINNFLEDPNIKIWQIKDENGYTALHRLVFKNNYELSSQIIDNVKKGLGLGSSYKIEDFIDEKTNEGFTALHYAAINGNIKMIKLLQKYGAKIDQVTNLGKNIMHLAAESNQPSIIAYFLLNEPLDLFTVDENGSTPLHWACYSGAYESVNYLLSLKADINALDKEKFTPLHLAVTNNREKIVRLLLQNGADKKIPNKNKELPIDIARNQNYMNIVNLLTDKDFNPLCTLEFPLQYIPPTDIYKKIILIMIIIPEIIIFFFVLPFLEDMYHTYANFGTFFLCLLTYFILIKKNPGYEKNYDLIKESQNAENQNPLKILVDKEVELKNYCPICYVEKADGKIKHCFICNKCVKELKHHCFWINKCIGKKNKFSYLAFIAFSFFYSIYSFYISIFVLFDSVHTPYEKVFPPKWLNLIFDRTLSVFGAGIILIFAIIISFPLFFLFMIEIFKSFKLFEKKKDINLDDEKESLIKDSLEFEKKGFEPLIDNLNKGENKEKINLNINKENDENEEINKNIIKKEDNENLNNIDNQNFPLFDGRPSNESNNS